MHNGKVYIRKRGANDIWENLYEFILAETTTAIPRNDLKQLLPFKKVLAKSTWTISKVSKEHRQQLTHQTIHGQFITISLAKPLQTEGYKAVTLRQLKKLPFPKFITAYLAENLE